jgi:hypothetical protein
MRNLNIRYQKLRDLINKLSAEFDVDPPKLAATSMSSIHGFYGVGVITINAMTVAHDFAEAKRTIRHEFCHYLQDQYDLPEKRVELQAKRFENDLWCLPILPKSQTTLEQFT